MKHKSGNYKISAVEHYLNPLNYIKTAEIFGCFRQSLMRWVKQSKMQGCALKIIRKSINHKIVKKHISFIKNILKEDKQITSKFF